MIISKIVLGSLVTGIGQITGNPAKSIQIRLIPLASELVELTTFVLGLSLIVAPIFPFILVTMGLFSFTALSFGIIIAVNPEAFKNRGDYIASGLLKRLVVTVTSGLAKLGAGFEGSANEQELTNRIGGELANIKVLLPISLLTIGKKHQQFLHYCALLYSFYIKSALVVILVSAALLIPFELAVDARIIDDSAVGTFTFITVLLAMAIITPIQKKLFKSIATEISPSGNTLTKTQMGIFVWCQLLSIILIGSVIAYFKLPSIINSLKSDVYDTQAHAQPDQPEKAGPTA